MRRPGRHRHLIAGTDELMNRALGAEDRGLIPGTEAVDEPLDVECQLLDVESRVLAGDGEDRIGERLEHRHGLGRGGPLQDPSAIDVVVGKYRGSPSGHEDALLEACEVLVREPPGPEA